MELRHLRYFVAVAEELNFRRAAERLHISQPPLSLQISQLEHEVGARLLERSRQGVALTAAGQTFLTKAQALLGLADEARQAAALAARGEAGELRVAYTPSAQFFSVFTRGVRRFREHNPGTLLHLEEMDSVGQINAILEGKIDLGLLPRPTDGLPSGVLLQRLIRDPMVLVSPQAASPRKRRPLCVMDLKHLPLICTPRHSGHGLNQHVVQACWRHGFAPNIVKESASLTSIAALVATGLGHAVLPQALSVLRLDGVAWRPFGDDVMPIEMCVATHAKREHRLADALRLLLVSEEVGADTG